MAAADGIVLGFVVLLVVGIWTDSISRSDTAIFAAIFGEPTKQVHATVMQSTGQQTC